MKKILIFAMTMLALFSCRKEDSAEIMLEGMAQRLFPEQAKYFEFRTVEDSSETFTVESKNGKIIVSGSNAISMAVGLNHYLREYCLTEVSWEAMNPVIMPEKLPILEKPLTGSARVKDRFFLNYCTYGYTMPWWGWKEWERLIDWMALNGVNMPLAITGEEAVWQKVWMKHGLTDEEVRSYFTGPAHLPWHRMCNVNGWQGPLPQEWIDGQVELQKQILARERAFGMRPVLPAFGGSVPLRFKELNPDAEITKVSQWGGFADEYRTYFLSPTDSLYPVLQKEFLEEQEALFGTDHLYGLDPFNEVQPPTWDPDVLASMAGGIYESLSSVDPDAVWVQMGWFLINDGVHWTPEITGAFMSAVPQGRLKVLDYYVDNTEIWKVRNRFYGQDYIVCALGNFGGNTMLQGDINLIGERMDEAIKNGGANMTGLGATLEGFGVNPDYYEFVFSKAWNTELSDEDWKNIMADRHVGFRSDESREAWKVIFDKIMPSYIGESGTLVCAHPNMTVRPQNKTYPEDLLAVWKKLLGIDSQRREHLFDIVNVGRQVLGEYFVFERDGFVRAFESNDADSLKYYGDRMLSMLDDLDRLLACSEEFSLQRWNEGARSFGSTPEEKDYYERNARTLITVWGDSPNLRDYANKTLSGMVSTYYKGRWKIFIEYAAKALESKSAFDKEACDQALWEFETAWTDPARTKISYPSAGDAVATANEILHKWFPE
jgi:alpha-N-acetylglucosaminidase